MQKACPGGWSISSAAPSATVPWATTSKPKLIALGSTWDRAPMLRRTLVTRLKRSAAARSWMISRIPWHSDISCTGEFLDHEVARYAGIESRYQQARPAPQIDACGETDEATDKSALGVEVPLVWGHGPVVLHQTLLQVDPVGKPAARGIGNAGARSGGMEWNRGGGFRGDAGCECREAGRQAGQLDQFGGEAGKDAVAVVSLQVGDERCGGDPLQCSGVGRFAVQMRLTGKNPVSRQAVGRTSRPA